MTVPGPGAKSFLEFCPHFVFCCNLLLLVSGRPSQCIVAAVGIVDVVNLVVEIVPGQLLFSVLLLVFAHGL